MIPVEPRQWMLEQWCAGHTLCLILDSAVARDTRQALLRDKGLGEFYSVYLQTPVSGLADGGPFLLLIDPADDHCIDGLLPAPQGNWGWLASIHGGELLDLVEHWRERTVVGVRPDQRLYRFHDNRVLARALRHLPEDALPAYLGPAISVCYWQGACWAVAVNPAPGRYAVPVAPAWLEMPLPERQAREILKANAHRYLLDVHEAAYIALADQRDPEVWLEQQVAQAQAWGWAAERLEFLLIVALTMPGHGQPDSWQPREGESPEAHFERFVQESQFWRGEVPL